MVKVSGYVVYVDNKNMEKFITIDKKYEIIRHFEIFHRGHYVLKNDVGGISWINGEKPRLKKSSNFNSKKIQQKKITL